MSDDLIVHNSIPRHLNASEHPSLPDQFCHVLVHGPVIDAVIGVKGEVEAQGGKVVLLLVPE